VITWIVAFFLLLPAASPLGAAVAATALSQLAGNGIRHHIQRSNGITPVFGHPFGVYLPTLLLLALAIGAAGTL
jgi:hypothetical protein